jgi:hypothetical protein
VRDRPSLKFLARGDSARSELARLIIADVMHDARRTPASRWRSSARWPATSTSAQIYVDVTDHRKSDGVTALERTPHPLAANTTFAHNPWWPANRTPIAW